MAYINGNKILFSPIVNITKEGECSGNHIIEVDTLPTDNIDTNAIYYCNGKYYRYEQLQDSPLGLRTFKEDATSGFEFEDVDRGIGVCFDIEPFTVDGVTVTKVSPVCTYEGEKQVIGHFIYEGMEFYEYLPFENVLPFTFRITNVDGLESWVADWVLENTNLIEASYGWVNYTPDCNEHHIHEVKELPESAIKGDMYHLGDSYHISERQAEGGYGWSEYVNKNTVDDSPLPIEVATESEMNTLLETSEVGSIFKYTGTTTDTYKNEALYIVEVPEDNSIVGTWLFYDQQPTATGTYFYIDFESNGETFSYLESYKASAGNYSWQVRYYKPNNGYILAYGHEWSQAYRTIRIVGGQDIANETFITWLKANATRVVS